MVVMKKEWMPEIDDPKYKFIASRARLVTLLRKQRFKTKDGYHLFDASGVFPKLRIKSSLTAKPLITCERKSKLVSSGPTSISMQ